MDKQAEKGLKQMSFKWPHPGKPLKGATRFVGEELVIEGGDMQSNQWFTVHVDPKTGKVIKSVNHDDIPVTPPAPSH